MARFVVLSRYTPDGLKKLWHDPEMTDLRQSVEEMNGKIVEQHFLLGDQDVLTVIDLPEANLAQVLCESPRTQRVVLPAIDQGLFTRLLSQSAETVGPHLWQTGLPARTARRLLRPYAFGRDRRQWFSEYTVHGADQLKGVRGPAVVIANHTSHFDFTALLFALPPRMRRRLVVAAAADRFFVKGRKGIKKQPWWFSLALNCIPMKRSGGGAALDYPKELIAKGWSIAIFPEGGRASGSKMAKFRPGAALLAISQQVPVIPLYMDGLAAIRPKGSSAKTPGPVDVWVGAPMYFSADADAHEATHDMFRSVDWLRRQARASHRAQDSAPPVPTPATAGSVEPNVVDLADSARTPRPDPPTDGATTGIDNETSAAS